MRSFKQEFYNEMQKQVKAFEHHETKTFPFLCNYIKNKNEKAIINISTDEVFKKQRSDKYIMLRIAQKRLEEGKISRIDYFRCLISAAADRKQLNDKEVFGICVKIYENIKDFCTGQKKYAAENSGIHAEYKNKLKIILENTKGAEIPDEVIDISFLNRLTEKVLNNILLQTAKERIYDIEKGRKSDDTMNMIDDFFRTTGNFSLSHNDFLSENNSCRKVDRKNFEDIEKLFNLMKSDYDMTYTVIPLAFDIKSGTGLYILGNEYIHDRKTIHHCVSYCILRQSDFTGTFSDCIENYNDKFSDANRAYESFINNTENSCYKTFNPEPPVDCPKIFLDYFEYDQEEYIEREKFKREMIQSERNEIKRRKQEYKKMSEFQ